MEQSPKSPQQMMSALADSLRERTGRTLKEWVLLVKSSGIDPRDQNSVRQWLKKAHGVLQNSQWAIAEAAARDTGWERPSVEGYIDQQFAGSKAVMRPVFDRIREIIEAFGTDVTIEGRSTYTPFVRGRQFAAIAAKRDRVDIGLRYTEAPVTTLLAPAKSPGTATHKLSVASLKQVTSEVEKLLRAAYDQNR